MNQDTEIVTDNGSESESGNEETEIEEVEVDEDINENENLFDLAEKENDEFCEDFVREDVNWDNLFEYARE